MCFQNAMMEKPFVRQCHSKKGGIERWSITHDKKFPEFVRLIQQFLMFFAVLVDLVFCCLDQMGFQDFPRGHSLILRLGNKPRFWILERHQTKGQDQIGNKLNFGKKKDGLVFSHMQTWAFWPVPTTNLPKSSIGFFSSSLNRAMYLFIIAEPMIWWGVPTNTNSRSDLVRIRNS